MPRSLNKLQVRRVVAKLKGFCGVEVGVCPEPPSGEAVAIANQIVAALQLACIDASLRLTLDRGVFLSNLPGIAIGATVKSAPARKLAKLITAALNDEKIDARYESGVVASATPVYAVVREEQT